MSVSLDIDNQPQGSEMSWRTKVGRRLAWERGTMNVGDRVKWVPTGQEGRIFEVRDGGIVAVRGEDWAIYDYADRFELVNECRVKPADVLDRAFDPEIPASSGSTGENDG